ncbi:MAG: ImmA/IrrE family metallo-endopeptidase [Planctomycetes bacterium]|nr:ImmA/IrrE family metallo-endopeptidase [Planctomycetota bacterium]
MFKPEELGKRLKDERERLDLTQKQVAEELGFNNYQSLLDIELGKREVKAWELAKLARIYQRNFDYFLEETAGTPPVQSKILWRAQSAKTPLIEQRFLHYIENYEKLERMVGGKQEKFKPISKWNTEEKSNFRKQPYSSIEELAKRYYHELNLGSRPACSFAKILEENLSVKLLYWDIRPAGSGASTVSDTYGPAILINLNDARWRQNYDIAHEFFHIITWHNFEENEISDLEKWAEAFASAILLPKDILETELYKRQTNHSITLSDLAELAHEFDVSIDALLWRLVNLGKLKKADIKDLLNGPLREIDRQKRSHASEEQQRFSPRFITLAIKAFQMGRISKAKLAEYLEIHFGKVTSLLRKYGYDENEDYSHAFTTA